MTRPEAEAMAREWLDNEDWPHDATTEQMTGWTASLAALLASAREEGRQEEREEIVAYLQTRMLGLVGCIDMAKAFERGDHRAKP